MQFDPVRPEIVQTPDYEEIYVGDANSRELSQAQTSMMRVPQGKK